MYHPNQAIREHSTRYGILTIVVGIVLLVGLRVWASPIGRRITGREAVTVEEYLLIPVFLVFVTVGILLFLWEPE